MFPKMEEAKKSPPDFVGVWKLIRSLSIARTKDTTNSKVPLGFFDLRLHDCVEIKSDKKSEQNAFAFVNIYKYSGLKDLVACEIYMFDKALSVAVFVGFSEEASPALWLRVEDKWYYRDHVKGVEIIPNQLSWQNIPLKDVALRISAVRGEESIYFVVKKKNGKELVLI